MLETTSELNELKSLLFDEEIDAFEAFEKRLTKLSFDLYDTEQVVSRVSPLVDEILLEKLQGKDEVYLEKYADLLAIVINRSAKQDFPKLRQSLQTVISPAITKEIENNKDKMVDALYPIMGSMISKYVSQAIKEMMETINNKIEDGLSFDKYKRKVKAKFTGVSEAELLLEEGADSVISSLFVIQKQTGLLIAEGHLENKEINDPHMVASMASAIRDFINDWVKNDESKNEVQILSYGNATLYIESAGSVYIIAFLDTEPNQEKRRDINTFFASLVKEYAGFFQDFDGDDSSTEIKTLSHKLNKYLVSNHIQIEEESNQKNPVKLILWIVGLGLVLYGLYHLYYWYDKYSLERKVYEQTKQNVDISNIDDVIHIDGQVDSIEHIYEIESLVKHHRRNHLLKNNMILPMKYIDQRMIEQGKHGNMKDYTLDLEMENLQTQLNESIKVLNRKIDILDNTMKQDKERLHAIMNIEGKLKLEMQKAFLGNNFYDRKKNALNFSTLNLFPNATLNYDEKILQKILNNVATYIKVLVPYKEYLKYIAIEAHSDTSGDNKKNKELSEQRAKIVFDFIKNLDIVKNNKISDYLYPNGYGSLYPILKNGKEDKIASRRIEIKLKLEESKILQKMREALND